MPTSSAGPVHCVMDRPLGSRHPRYPDMLYPVNYGCVPGVMAGDGAEQDVYVLGPTAPLETFNGVVIAVIHRFDDCEDKWVVAERTAPGTRRRRSAQPSRFRKNITAARSCCKAPVRFSGD